MPAKPSSPVSPSKAAAAVHGRYLGRGAPGPRGSRFEVVPRVVLIVSVVALPDGLPAIIVAGPIEQVVAASPSGTAQPKLTSMGIGIFDGFVTTSSMTVAATPRVICTVPGVTMATLISTLAMTGLTANVATAGAALLP